MSFRIITFMLVVLVFSCNTPTQTNPLTNSSSGVIDTSVMILPFPFYSPSGVRYLNCENLTQNNHKIKIHKDTTIELNTLDNKMSGSIRFDWGYSNFYKIVGINSFEIIKNSSKIFHQDLTSIISLEAYPDNDSNSYFHDKPYKEIELIDINFDSYLDLVIPRSSGKRWFYAYFIYDNKSQTFQYHQELDWLVPYSYDCENSIIYSFDGGTASTVYESAYQFHGNMFEQIQVVFTSYETDSIVVEYYNSNRDLIKRETSKRKSNN